MSADWPYDDADPDREPPGDPEWACPDGTCQCELHEEAPELQEVSVMLCDARGERMPGARCRVFVDGELVNEDTPNADGAGWITFPLEHDSRTATIEWAPADTPKKPCYPYRRRVFIDPGREKRDEAARRRLHNLGFSVDGTLRQSVRRFQRHYGLDPVSGEVADIEGYLSLYHDQAMVPGRAAAGAPESPGSSVESLSSTPHQPPPVPGPPVPPATPATPAPPPPPPGSLGGKPKPPVTVQPLAWLPSPRGAWLWSGFFFGPRVDYDWAPITTSHTNRYGSHYEARFWIFRDAFKWEVPAFFSEWDKWESLDVFTRSTRMCRLPSSARQAQELADMLLTTPRDLPDRRVELDEDLPAEPCILPTEKLYRERWRQADCKIPVRNNGSPTGPTSDIVGDSGYMNKGVNDEVRKQFPSAPPSIVADPGKIWSIEHRTRDPYHRSDQTTYPYLAAVNYGWHRPSGVPWQHSGVAHPADHVDYSQVVVLVAGWCELTYPDGTTRWKRTRSIYRKSWLRGLVVDVDKPLHIAYDWDPAITDGPGREADVPGAPNAPGTTP